MGRPLVSIITPSYNKGRFIEQTIISVISQDYPNIEYLIVDGGSNDSTLEVLKKYEDKLMWISEPDKGQSDAINKGFMMAKGEILCWLNADDTYEPCAVSKAVNFFLANPDVMMIYGEGNEIDANGVLLHRFPTSRIYNLSKLIHVCDYILQPTTFFRRSILDKIGLLNTELHWCMDWDFWIRIGSQFQVAYVDYVFAMSRVYPDTKTHLGGKERFKEIVSVMRKYGKLKYPLGYFIYGLNTIEIVTNRQYPIVYFFLRVVFFPIKVVLTWITRVFTGIDL